MEECERAPSFHTEAPEVIRQVELQSQSKLRIDRVDVEVRAVIDSQHDVRDAEEFMAEFDANTSAVRR